MLGNLLLVVLEVLYKSTVWILFIFVLYRHDSLQTIKSFHCERWKLRAFERYKDTYLKFNFFLVKKAYLRVPRY
jgi:hypothetical protein